MSPEPRATYRLQLGPDFGFDVAAGLVPYLAQLGVSHLYLSPCLQAARGSRHGYDVVDPTRVNAELGGEAAFRRLVAALEEAGLGLMVDLVPNHMAIPAAENPWWWDVLENGPSSPYALYFDVDWAATEERWPDKVLLPVLEDHYGRVLESLSLRLEHADGGFALHYGAQVFPLDLSTLDGLLAGAASACDSEPLAFLAESCARLPRPQVRDRGRVQRRHRDKEVIRSLLARLCREEPEAAAAIAAEVVRHNSDPDALDGLLERQNYRLALWRTAGRDLGYRRFFDINELAGLRVEEEEVFFAIHALPLEWVRQGLVQGLRIDHPDGMRDPAQYFQRLREVAPGAWIVAEKILARGEELPEAWPIDGTTGYDFLNRVGGLFVDPAGAAPLSALWGEISGADEDFATVRYECKREVVSELLGSELNRLTALLVAVCERHRRHRDYTRHELQAALLELAACFPVYRSYVQAETGAVSAADRAHILAAVAEAGERRPEIDPELFRFLGELLLLERGGALEGELAMRFQQLTGPAMAKGVEDTAFYRYLPLAGLNEVGGDPDRFGVSVADFHAACADTLARCPRTLLATSTHDTKRGEEVRARLALLSEMPTEWGHTVCAWMDRNAGHRRRHPIDPATEYLLYQTLVGAWPIDADRLTAYLEKAVREAKVHSSWSRPQADYEAAVQGFAAALLADAGFREGLEAFVGPLLGPGQVNSLAQTLLKLTVPGVPDLYQGSELSDLSLVDPDNRRPVDFATRAAALSGLDDLAPEAILAHAGEGLPKIWVIRQALGLRRRRPAAFGPEGDYRPLWAAGERADHLVACLRGGTVAVAVPRLVLGLAGAWGDTAVELPSGGWRNLLDGGTFMGGRVAAAALLGRFPVALLEREEGGP
jgi:(1->4)-alpha-D-glucan 1-alpha-D-glucosylmutase